MSPIRRILFSYLENEQIPYANLHTQKATLNDFFLEITGKELRDYGGDLMFWHLFYYRLKVLLKILKWCVCPIRIFARYCQ